MDYEIDGRLAELTATVAHSAGVARDALDEAERAVLRRNAAVRAAANAGVTVGSVVSATGLSRAEVYRIIDEADS